MELFDLYDKYRCKTGKTHERGIELKKDDYHLVVHVWIVNDKGQFLIQKRQPWKIGWPNMWDCSAAGSVISGEDSQQGAIRESKEELGIDIDMKRAEILFTVKFTRGFDDIWLVKQNVDIESLKLQYEEVADAKWVTFKEIMEMARDGEFIGYHYLDSLHEMIKSNISLRKAMVYDAEEIHAMQNDVFKSLHENCKDLKTTLVIQTMNMLLNRIDKGDYYKILINENLIGSIYVYPREPGKMKLHTIGILEEYQNKGIAQNILKRIELMYPEAISWELETLESEERNCHLYEKLGYIMDGEVYEIDDNIKIITYKKEVDIPIIEEI